MTSSNRHVGAELAQEEIDGIVERLRRGSAFSASPLAPNTSSCGKKSTADDAVKMLLEVDPAEWAEAVHGHEDFFNSFGAHLPKEMRSEHEYLARRVSEAMTPPDLQGRDVGH